MASSSTKGSLNVPFIHSDDPSLTRSDSNSDASSGSTTKKKSMMPFLATASIAAFLLVGSYYCRKPNVSFSDILYYDDTHVQSDATYGVDVSWPIHGTINERNDYRRPEARFAKDSRRKAYVQHLQGCRAYYSQEKFPDSQGVCDAYEYDRLLMNARQPQSMENYTETGFQKTRTPPRLARLIQDFWDKNKDKQVPEVWPEGNIYLNHWNSPSMMVSVDDTGLRGSGYMLKLQIWEALRPIISKWTGGQAVHPVSMYGIRVYTNGSLLVPHVDRLPLVASAMINVAQDVEEDWPMEVYSHKTGMAHNITLAPGDMLLFESHSLMHGRPFPLNGKYYAMLFIHFEPTGQTPLVEREAVDEQYRRAVQDGVGGQSSSEQSQNLPPYIRRFSPEEENWQEENPDGWHSPVLSPSSFQAGDTTDGEAKTDKQQPKNSEAHRAASDGNVNYWIDALDKAEDQYELVHRRDSYGWQPIHEAAANGHEDLVDLLLLHGANINARTNGGRGGTPLYFAQHKLGAKHSIVRYLVDNGALSIPPDKFKDEL